MGLGVGLPTQKLREEDSQRQKRRTRRTLDFKKEDTKGGQTKYVILPVSN